MLILFKFGLIKKTLHKLIQSFSKSWRSFDENVKVELDLSIYATKAELKHATEVDTFAL